ncbi:MAG: hypothetical protein L3J14_01725 [Flavobacteriaceae bacterium]|nr:hypothetical protein [Flavobacteriaceae bacterium]
MKKILFIAFCLISISIYSQQEIFQNSWVKFSKDSIINSSLEKSLNAFLIEANKANFENQYINEEHYKKYEYFFQQFEKYSNSNYYKDSLFFKPQLLKSFSYDKKEFYITLQFVGVDDKKPFVRKILEFKAIPKEDYYQFFCLFEENIKHWKSDKKGGVTFHYTDTYNEKKAIRFVKFNEELERLTKKKSPIYHYYKCKDTQEALSIFGIKYSYRRANSDYGFGLSDEYGNFITGINSEDYLHDHVHSFFGKIYENKETWREFEEGIAIYYGGNWGVHLSELKTVLRNELKSNPNFDFLSEFKKARKSKRYDGKHLYNRIINAVFAELIIKKHGFDAAIEVLHCGNNGEQIYTQLDNKLGINEKNFLSYTLRRHNLLLIFSQL